MAVSNSNDLKEVTVHGHIQSLVANPTPLGLFGLAVVTLVASSAKLGLTTGTAWIIPWAIFLGAAAQMFAGIYDFKHNNTFGATAFFSYGMFWFGMALSWAAQNGVFGAKTAENIDPHQMGFAFLAYFIFTVYMTFGAMGVNKVLFIIFFLIDTLFLGLFMNNLFGGEMWHMLAAWSELGISIFAFYGSAAAVLNTHYNQVVLPVGAAFGPWVNSPAPASAKGKAKA
ncbi:MAG: acetate uptake transporter [Methylocystaceae bacterium]